MFTWSCSTQPATLVCTCEIRDSSGTTVATARTSCVSDSRPTTSRRMPSAWTVPASTSTGTRSCVDAVPVGLGHGRTTQRRDDGLVRRTERPPGARMLHPQCAREHDGRHRRGRHGSADSSKSGKECHWTIASYDPMARPRRAHARPSSVSAAIRSACTEPERLHGFDDADERQLARGVARDGRFDRHPRARQDVAA